MTEITETAAAVTVTAAVAVVPAPPAFTPLRVVSIGRDEVCFSFSSSLPFICRPHARHGGTVHEQVDPTPCYPHELAVVEHEAARMVATFPLGVPVVVASLSNEVDGRVNGFCAIDMDYKAESPYPWGAGIVLSGKRTPIHPAMTRYLVAHEYGHAADRCVAERRGQTEDDFRQFYRELRGMPPESPRYYGPGSWHAWVSELIANDFRILVAKSEVEYWPHPGFPRPEALPAIRDFWKEHAA